MNKVRISGQRAYFFKTPEPVPKSQVGFSEIEFVFDSSWDEYPTRLAQFSQNGLILNVPIESNKCCVPSGLDVGVVTLSIRGDRADHSIAAVNCLTMEVCCSFEEGGSPPVPPTPDLYNRLLSDVEEAAKSAYPKGGTKGQVLTKMSDADRDFGWSDAADGSGFDGGYYTPEVTQPSDDTMKVAFTASKGSMPAVEAVSVALPRGEDGEPGVPGKDGVSPTVQTETIDGGTRVTITDAEGAKTFDVLNGEKGDSIVPPPTPEDAGKALVVNGDGTGLKYGDAPGGAGIDDAVIATDSTWSSRMIVDSLAPAFEETGAVVTCNPVAGYPLSIQAQIVPMQEGSGDPSPENVRPISGFVSALLSQIGQNIWNGERNIFVQKKELYIFGLNIPPAKYNVSANVISSDVDRDDNLIMFYYSDGSGVARCLLSRNAYSTTTIDIQKHVDHISFFASGGALQSENDNADYRDFMLSVYGSPVTGYVPYNPASKIITIPFGQTIYGGTLDVATGMVTVTQTEIASYNGEDLPGGWISDRDIYSPGETPTIGAQVVYELAEPQTVQLAPQEILALSGVNTIYSDTGDVTVSGRADPNAIIQQLAARIAALESAATQI